MAKKEKVTYKCLNEHKFTIVYNGWYPTKPCPKCGDTAYMYDKNAESAPTSININTHEEAVAFWKTPSGAMIATNKKGNIIDNHHYNLRNDPNGWKATGKKVREYDDRGRRQ